MTKSQALVDSDDHQCARETIFQNQICNSKPDCWVLDSISGNKSVTGGLYPNDVGLRFDGDRKYIVKEGDYKVSIWKDAGIVYTMVI